MLAEFHKNPLNRVMVVIIVPTCRLLRPIYLQNLKHLSFGGWRLGAKAGNGPGINETYYKRQLRPVINIQPLLRHNRDLLPGIYVHDVAPPVHIINLWVSFMKNS